MVYTHFLRFFMEFENKEKEKKILFQALREYFPLELPVGFMLSRCKIIDCWGLYDSILDQIDRYC